jgi:hypothetical protein
MTVALPFSYVCTGVCGCDSGEVTARTRQGLQLTDCRPFFGLGGGALSAKEVATFQRNENPLNGKCANRELSHQRGSPHYSVPNCAQVNIIWMVVSPC